MQDDIGADSVSEAKQVMDICTIIKRFLLSPERIKFPDPRMKTDFVFPIGDVMRASSSYKSFKNAQYVSKAELFKRVIDTLETWGVIAQVKKFDLIAKYDYHGKAFCITDANFFLRDEFKNLKTHGNKQK